MEQTAAMSIDWNEAENFGDVIDMAAAAHGDKVAFRDARQNMSFAQYHTQIHAVAGGLRARGLSAGDRVAILSHGRIEVVVLLGLCAAGFVPVPLNWRLSAAELARLIKDCGPKALFVEDRFQEVLPAIEAVTDELPLIVTIEGTSPASYSYAELAACDPEAAPDGPAGEDAACLLYTSGTTGAPKGVLLTHRAAIGNCRDVARDAFGFTADDVTLMAMPLFHVGGIWYYLFPSFASGCTTIIQERFDPDAVITAMGRERVTNIHIVPTMLGDLLSRDGLLEATSNLRLIVYAGSSMPSDLLHRGVEALPNCAFAQAYGSTEGGSITALSAQDHAKALEDPAWAHLLRSCGRPIGDVEIQIVPQDDRSSEPMGEILVRSSKLMAGYWQRPEDTAEKIVDGWLYTGDVGHVDRDGYLYIVDRKNDMIISGGENVFPFEVEEVLCQHEAVTEAAVFGIADPRWVERLVAAIVLHPDMSADPKDIIAFVRARLAGYKTPKSVIILPSLPRSAVGKVLRKELRSEYADFAG